MDTKILEIEIGKMELGDNDYLVLRFPENTHQLILEDAQETIKTKFSDLADRVIILVGIEEIYVVHKQ